MRRRGAGTRARTWAVRAATVILLAAVLIPAAAPADAQAQGGPYTLTLTMAGTRGADSLEQSVSFQPAATTCVASCTRDFGAGTVVTMVAHTTGAGITFVGWSGGGCSGTGSCTVTMDAAKSVTATFKQRPSLRVSIRSSGTVKSSPAGIDCTGFNVTCSTNFEPGTTVTLTATAPSHYVFLGWSMAGCSGTGTCTVTLTGDTEVRADFAASNTLTVVKQGSGTVTGGGIDCGATCSATIIGSDSGPLTAVAAPGHRFESWTGCTAVQGAVCSVTMTGDKTVTAKFIGQQELTVTKAGTGSGTVTTSPVGIQCGQTCAQFFDPGTVVSVVQSADWGSTFTGWSGGGCSGTGACTVTMDAAKSVTATFTSTPTLSVVKMGSGAGNVTSVLPAGIDCGPTCGAVFAPHTTVGLRATPEPGTVFSHWAGCDYITGDNMCVVTVNSIVTITATFVIGRKLKVTAGGGVNTDKVTITPGDRVCHVLTPCEDYYLPDSVVELTASPGAGSRFTGWSGGACSGPEPTCTVTLDSDKEVKAEFVVLHTVTVTKSGSGSGTVTNTPAGIDCGATCTGTFDHGTPIILTATPAAGSAFAGWSGGGCSGTGPCEVADADASVTATFVAESAATPPPSGGGITPPTPTPTITPTPDAETPAKIHVAVTGKRRGKRVRLKLRLTGAPVSSDKTIVVVDLLKGTRKIATATGVIRSGRAVLKLRAERAVPKGRYRVRVRVRQGTTTTLAPVPLRLR